jgi:pantothenate synthetase
MVANRDIPTRIEVLPIIRETDGLAMSSRTAGSTPTSASAPPLWWRNLKFLVSGLWGP